MHLCVIHLGLSCRSLASWLCLFKKAPVGYIMQRQYGIQFAFFFLLSKRVLFGNMYIPKWYSHKTNWNKAKQ